MRKGIGELLQRAEELIVAGQIREAGEWLARLKPKRIPRKHLRHAAQLYRRVGWVEQGLRLLMPIVRPKNSLLEPASPEEQAEYAVGLQYAGSLEEARQILERISEKDVPEVLLYKAIFRFPDWDYAGAIPELNRLIQISSPESYLGQVARLNLAAAFVAEERFHDSSPLLEDLRQTTAERGLNLLNCNALEISAQAAIFARNFNRAEQMLNEAERLITGIKTFDRLWLIKWRAILNAMRESDISLLPPAYTEARRKSHWETVRELDFITCKIKPDENLLLKLFFGSRAEGYRRRLARHFDPPRFDRVYRMPNGVFAPTPPKAFINCFRDLRDELSPGDLPHILLALFLSDAYSGFRSGEIHCRLFPKQFFNPFTSLDRVYHVVQRLRSALGAQTPGIGVCSEDGFYKLEFNAPEMPIEIPREWPTQSALNMKLHALRERLQQDQFRSEDVQKALNLSRAAANRLISAWREAHVVDRHGASNPPRYKLKNVA